MTAIAAMAVNLSCLFLPEDGVALGTVSLLSGVALYNVLANDIATIAYFTCMVGARVTNIWIMYPKQTYAELNFVMYYLLMLYWIAFFPMIILYGGDHVRMLNTFIASVPATMAIDVYSSGVYEDLPMASRAQAGWVLSTFCYAYSSLYVVKTNKITLTLAAGSVGIIVGFSVSFAQNAVPQGIAGVALLLVLWLTAAYVALPAAKIVRMCMEVQRESSQEKTR